MPDSADIVQGGLTWRVLRQVFPVAPSLRREHWDLLSGTGVEESQRGDDEIFYGSLLHKFRRDGEFIVDLDRRFLGSKKKKDQEKAFTYRAGRWLLQQIPDLLDYDDILDAPPGLFGENTAERGLRDLIAEMRRVERQAKADLAPRIEDRWRSAGTALRALLDELDRPTPEAVERIEAAAQTLLDAGREIRNLAAELERSRAGIRLLLEPFSDRSRATRILERLDSLDAPQLAELAEIALETRGPIAALAGMETGLAAKEKEFEKLRAEGAPWAAVARQAEALAELEAEKDRQLAAVETLFARMAAASTAVEAGEPEAGPAPRLAKRRNRAKPAEGAFAPPQDRDAPDEDRSGPGIALPATWKEFPAWCGEHLADRLILSPRARNTIKKTQYEDVETAAKCLLWLAGDYRRARLDGAGDDLRGPIDSGLWNDRCGGDSFPFDWNGKRVEVEWHVKNGGNTTDPARCLRIYYFWDEAGRRVVVASMPDHIPNGAV
ncbi:MAG: hypothetical protein F4Y03_10350 [Alphaproteobacteria bacterium]|nr:hypothetical protein [Alphaproteobacteria bacterium]